MRISRISTGSVRLKQGAKGIRRYFPGGWRDETLPVNVFLVHHSDGICLFDTGQNEKAAHSRYFPFWHPFFKLARFELTARQEAYFQIRDAGVDPSLVRWTVLSHLHTDHAGGIGHFTNSVVFVSRREWEQSLGVRGRLRGYLPQYWPKGLKPRLVEFGGDPVGPFSASFDICGDKRLVLVPTDGHTEGHMALIVNSKSGGSFLCGDLANSAEDLQQRHPAIAEFCRAQGLRILASHGEVPPEPEAR